MEEDKARVEVLGAQEDPRIDVCLYFVAAHRLKAIDLKFMRSIAARVALIPVIAKADRCVCVCVCVYG
jgi:septin family protein